MSFNPRAICLGDVVTEEVRNLLGNRCFDTAGLVIGSSAPAKVKIANTINYCIDGILYTKTSAEIAHTNLAVQAADTTKFYLLSLDKSGNGLITQGVSVLTATLTAEIARLVALGYSSTDASNIAEGKLCPLPKLDSAQTVIGAIKVVTVAVTFTPATDSQAASGVTTTYYNLSCVPTIGLPA